MDTPRYTYLISNRSASNPNAEVGPVTFLRAPNVMGRRYRSAGFAQVDVASWVDSLVADLAEEPDPGDLAFYIHGFGISEEWARLGLEQYGLALTGVGFDRGIVVGVSWPSNTWTPGGAQQNAAASALLVDAVGAAIKEVSKRRKVRASVLCHSMGNYLLASTLAGSARLPLLDTIFMLAADVDHDIWDPGSRNHRQGLAIEAAAKQGYVLYTQNDTVLLHAGTINGVTRLGYSGAKDAAQLPANVAQCDYSAQGNGTSATNWVPYAYLHTIVGTGALVHSSSRFHPDVLSFTRLGVQRVPGRFDLGPTDDPATLHAALRGDAPESAPARPGPEALR